MYQFYWFINKLKVRLNLSVKVFIQSCIIVGSFEVYGTTSLRDQLLDSTIFVIWLKQEADEVKYQLSA